MVRNIYRTIHLAKLSLRTRTTEFMR